jgi:hypothetical protein
VAYLHQVQDRVLSPEERRLEAQCGRSPAELSSACRERMRLHAGRARCLARLLASVHPKHALPPSQARAACWGEKP